MADTHVPITDAFDDTDQLESLEVELTSEQLSWLRGKADERGVSLDHMLRTILTAQMDGIPDLPSPSSRSGDGAPQSAPDAPAGSTDTTRSDPDTRSLVESLRSASKRLDDLTDEDEEGEEDDSTHSLHDTLSRLKARVDSTTDDANTEDDPGTVLMDNTSQSMFDMVD